MKKIEWNLLNDTIIWWEKRRIFFNFIVGLSGLLSILLISPYFFGITEIIGVIFWGVLANILYSSGILIEIYNLYYFNSKVCFWKFRFTFFYSGLLLYSAVTFYYPFLYFLPILD